MKDISMTAFHETRLPARLAFGCTGGRHRSVAMAEELGARLRERGMEVRVNHRDVGEQ